VSEKVVSAEERGFLDAILDEPDDDVPRLVYADWLTERGDPRGEFIQVQCRLARTPRYEPTPRESHQREQDLLRAWRSEWERPYRKFEFIRHVSFKRGFLNQLSFPASRFMEVGDLVYQIGPIETVSLVPDSIAHYQAAAASPLLRRVTSLSSFPKYGSLAWLCDSPYLDKLSKVDANETFLTPDVLGRLLSSPNLPRLADVSLWRCRLGRWDRSAIRTLVTHAKPNRLKCLNLADNDLKNEDVEAISGSSRLAGLHTLILRGNPELGGPALASLASSPHLTRLERLDLEGCPQIAVGLKELSATDTLMSLTSLVLADTKIVEDDLVRFVRRPVAQNLRHLDLRRTKLGVAVVKAMVNSPHLDRLVNLNLRGVGLDSLSRESMRKRFGDAVSM
jgi:uncharacterized protein (TIGR02996 family)